MQKRLTRFVVLMALVLTMIYLFQRKQWLPDLKELFSSHPPTIERTAILVKSVNNLAQLITITAYNEIAIDSLKKGWALFNNPLIPSLLNVPNLRKPDHRLVIIGKGKILAGVDLAKITPADMFVSKDSVSLLLPKPAILQVVLNPSGFEIFEEKGKWTDQEITEVKIKLRDKLVANALQQNLLQKSGSLAIVKMEHFLRTAGFTKVSVRIRP